MSNNENCIFNWSARAIWLKSNLLKPLDIVHNRQNITPNDDSQAVSMFVNLLNLKQVMDKLQKFAAECSYTEKTDEFRHIIEIESHELDTMKNHLKIEGDFVLVLYGKCFELGDYFYVGCSLNYKNLAPTELISNSAIYIKEIELKKIQVNRENTYSNVLFKQKRRQHNIEKKERIKTVAKLFENAKLKNVGEPLSIGDAVKIYVNQGMRDGIVISIYNNEALVRYYMPNGREFLRSIDASTHYTLAVISANRIPKKFAINP